jgi:hypothetical protein
MRAPSTLPSDKPFPNPLGICEDGSDGWTLSANPDMAGAMAVNRIGGRNRRLADGRLKVKLANTHISTIVQGRMRTRTAHSLPR